jgi:phosphoglycolate phosphatase
VTRTPDLVVGFDLDMTLIDSRPGVAATFAALNRELGTTIDGEAIADRLGPTLESEMAAYFAEDAVPAVCDRYRVLYAKLGPPGSSLLRGAAAAFEAVHAAGGHTLVVTAKYEPNARRCLDHVGLRADRVVGGRHGPEKAETLAEHRAALYVGDTPPDMEAARAAGAIGVGVTTGPWPASSLATAGADAVLASLDEFPDWFARRVG